LHLRISRLLAILVLLVALSLVVSLIATGLLLIGHEKPFLRVFVVQSAPCATRTAKQAESAPHGSFKLNASFLLLCCRAVTMNKPSTLHNAMKKHDIYETNKRAVL